MKPKCKSKLLDDIEKMIGEFNIKKIYVTRKQFEELLYELFRFSDKNPKNQFEYKNSIIQKWGLSPICTSKHDR